MRGKCVTLAVIVVLAFLAPAAASAATLRSGTMPAAEPCLSDDPYNLKALAEVIGRTAPPSAPVMINEHVKVEFVRSATMSDSEEETPLGPRTRGVPQPSEPTLQNSKLDNAPVRIFNTRTQLEYRVTFSDAMLTDIYSCHERKGMTDGGGPGKFGAIEGWLRSFLPNVGRGAGGPANQTPGSDNAAVPLGWSNGDDSRILRTPTTLWPWRTITQSSSWPNGENSRCTMTLIGPRHLITAAHCIVNFGTSNWKSRKLIPARDGPGVAPYGISQMTTNPPPGVESWYIVPDPWLNPNTDNEFQWDIGLVLMVDRLGDQTGWMGYGALNAADLNPRNHWNRGYPGCQDSYTEKPANCQTARLYGDEEQCEIGYYHDQGSNGWNRQFAFSCDISRGHSGSPIYHYRFSQSKNAYVPVVVAVVSWHECFTCDEDDDYPNHARRITPWVYGAIGWLKEQFP